MDIFANVFDRKLKSGIYVSPAGDLHKYNSLINMLINELTKALL